MPKNNGPAVREKRRAEAEARQRLRDERSAKQQLAVLDARLGAGKGATRERARLTKEKGENKETKE